MKFKIIFSIQFFLYNSLNFQDLLSQNNFFIDQLVVKVSMVLSYFISINGLLKNNMNSNVINVISNKKGLKMIQYFKNKLLPQGNLSLQGTHCTKPNEASWREEFNATFFFAMDCLIPAEF